MSMNTRWVVSLRARAPSLCACAGLLAMLLVDVREVRAEDLLRGPHPFLKQNALTFSGGLSAAAGDAVGGLRAQVAYGYELVGGLWFDLQVGFTDGSDTPVDERPCSGCGTAADVLVGASYRLRMNIPVVPYGKLSGGLVYVFPDRGESVMGLAVRPAVGARYYLYDWLGFGVEIGALLGFADHDERSGLSRALANLEVLVGGEWQF